jgi:hypothetical protein
MVIRFVCLILYSSPYLRVHSCKAFHPTHVFLSCGRRRKFGPDLPREFESRLAVSDNFYFFLLENIIFLVLSTLLRDSFWTVRQSYFTLIENYFQISH